MNNKWFKEERSLPKSEQTKAIKEAKEILSHSVFMSDKLKRIIKEELELTYLKDEEVELPGWEQRALANAGARKALRKLLELLP